MSGTKVHALCISPQPVPGTPGPVGMCQTPSRGCKVGPTESSRNQGLDPVCPCCSLASWVLLMRSIGCCISGHRASSRPVAFAPHHHASPCGLSDEETQADDLLGTERTAAFKGPLGDSPLLGPEQWPRASRMCSPCLPSANVWHRVDAQKIFVEGTWNFQACGGDTECHWTPHWFRVWLPCLPRAVLN